MLRITGQISFLINAIENLLDASFIKPGISLSYRLPASLLKRTPFSGVNIGITGRNLLLATPKENTYVDPETIHSVQATSRVLNLEVYHQ